MLIWTEIFEARPVYLHAGLFLARSSWRMSEIVFRDVSYFFGLLCAGPINYKFDTLGITAYRIGRTVTVLQGVSGKKRTRGNALHFWAEEV